MKRFSLLMFSFEISVNDFFYLSVSMKSFVGFLLTIIGEDVKILTGIFDVDFVRLIELINGECWADLDSIIDNEVFSTVIDGSCEIERRLDFVIIRCLLFEDFVCLKWWWKLGQDGWCWCIDFLRKVFNDAHLQVAQRGQSSTGIGSYPCNNGSRQSRRVSAKTKSSFEGVERILNKQFSGVRDDSAIIVVLILILVVAAIQPKIVICIILFILWIE